MRFYTLVLLQIFSLNIFAQDTLWENSRITALSERDSRAIVLVNNQLKTLTVGETTVGDFTVNSISSIKVVLESNSEIIWLLKNPDTSNTQFHRFIKNDHNTFKSNIEVNESGSRINGASFNKTNSVYSEKRNK